MISVSIRNIAALVLSTALLTACGGGGSSADNTAPNAPSSASLSTAGDGSVTVTGLAEPSSKVSAIFPDGEEKSVTADANGYFSLTSDPLQPSGSTLITSTDAGGNTSASTSVTSTASTETIKALYLATGVMPALSFVPSLGINTEGPQGGADTAGMPIPFVDIFRTARPFKESQRIAKTDANGDVVFDSDNNIVYIQNSTTYDNNGWPTSIDPNKTSVSASLLQGSLKDSIPEGQYIALYEGSGTLNFSTSGSVSAQTKVANQNKILLDIKLKDFIFEAGDDERERERKISSTNQIYSYITNISSSSYVKNIRIIMPGGTCTGNPFIRVDETDTCPNGTTYQSFEDRLLADRNAIIFNPDYLMFLRNFKVIRMMNLMEASLKKLCYDPATCPANVGTWADRATLSDAVWGGNDGRTAHEDHKGVPLEVVIALANTLDRDMWLNMPHVASDDYISNAAEMMNSDLKSNLKVYLEYSNEVWNSGFAAYQYMAKKGADLGLNTIPQGLEVSPSPSDIFTRNCGASLTQKERDARRCKNYFSRLRYHSKRSVEIFDLWATKFSNTRLTRVLGSFIGDKILTEQMLKTVPTNKIDAVAIAPYFFGCPYQAICVDAPKTLLSATTVDDIFAALDQSGTIDVKSIDGTIDAVKNQLSITNQFSIKLVSYEGGQHLVTGVLGNNVTTADQTRLRKLFNEANRDPRMKQRYETFLNAWKDLSDEGTALFTLYTMPQSYYRYGNFGIKEHLNKARAESPKFDGVMSFQEAVGNCWWDEAGCTP
jgi:hypothetical protein